jgi:uncharacterized protein YcgL (UPF0745 family)
MKESEYTAIEIYKTTKKRLDSYKFREKSKESYNDVLEKILEMFGKDLKVYLKKLREKKVLEKNE